MRTALALLGTFALLAGLTLAPTPAGADAPRPADRATRVTVVRPVTAYGDPAPGWRVHRERGAATCDGASTSAVDDGIVSCSPSAMYLPSCWRSTHHTVLCVRDVTSHRLVRVRYRGSFPHVTAPAHPSPQALRLGRGQACSVRVGGAWGTVPTHPRWLGFYSCARGSVYGPARGDGIDRSHPRWRVHLVRSDDSVVSRTVRLGTLVGTAA
jgi:hypothetical protein